MTITEPQFKLQHYMRLALEESGMGIGEIAERLEVAPDTISRWLHGRSRPSNPTLMAWAQVTGVDYEWLCARRDSNPQPSDPYPLGQDRCRDCGRTDGTCETWCACGWCGPELLDDAFFAIVADLEEVPA